MFRLNQLLFTGAAALNLRSGFVIDSNEDCLIQIKQNSQVLFQSDN